MKRGVFPLIFASLLVIVPTSRADNPTPKKKKNAWLQNLGKTLGGGSNTNRPTAVAGVRGLDEPIKEGDLSVRNYPYMDHLEALTVSDEELKKFREEGKLE